MDDAQVGWIAAIIIGGVAGWLAEQFMKSDMGLLMNIVLGVIGAAVASAILSFFGIHLGGWIGYLIAGFIGACLLIWIVRAFLMCLRVAHDAADYWSARITEPHIVVVLVPMVRTTAFACRYKNKMCVNLRMHHRMARVAARRFWIFDFNPGFRGPSKLQIR
jgi:uncharacterized membrane protein YeaQ/YmgE (transglycosylase-associated protein family)